MPPKSNQSDKDIEKTQEGNNNFKGLNKQESGNLHEIINASLGIKAEFQKNK